MQQTLRSNDQNCILSAPAQFEVTSKGGIDHDTQNHASIRATAFVLAAFGRGFGVQWKQFCHAIYVPHFANEVLLAPCEAVRVNRLLQMAASGWRYLSRRSPAWVLSTRTSGVQTEFFVHNNSASMQRQRWAWILLTFRSCTDQLKTPKSGFSLLSRVYKYNQHLKAFSHGERAIVSGVKRPYVNFASAVFLCEHVCWQQLFPIVGGTFVWACPPFIPCQEGSTKGHEYDQAKPQIPESQWAASDQFYRSKTKQCHMCIFTTTKEALFLRGTFWFSFRPLLPGDCTSLSPELHWRLAVLNSSYWGAILRCSNLIVDTNQVPKLVPSGLLLGLPMHSPARTCHLSFSFQLRITMQYNDVTHSQAQLAAVPRWIQSGILHTHLHQFEKGAFSYAKCWQRKISIGSSLFSQGRYNRKERLNVLL